MKTFNATLFRSNVLWNENLTNSPVDVLQSDEEVGNIRTELHSTFDYEKKPGYRWHIHFYIGIKIEGLMYLSVRTSFEIKKRNTNWYELFSSNLIQPLLTSSVQQAYNALPDNANENSLELPGVITLDLFLKDEVITEMTKDIVYRYRDFCMQDDINNEKLINVLGLDCTMGYETSMVIKATFIVLDEVLFHNKNFDRENNREVFFDVVPETKYQTLKFNCLDIDNHKVKLSLYSSVFFLISIDCALQILISDKADFLNPTLEQRGITSEVLKDYFRCGTELFNTMNLSFQASNVHIVNLEQKYEWYKLIR